MPDKQLVLTDPDGDTLTCYQSVRTDRRGYFVIRIEQDGDICVVHLSPENARQLANKLVGGDYREPAKPEDDNAGESVSEAEYDGQAIITHVHGDLIFNVGPER